MHGLICSHLACIMAYALEWTFFVQAEKIARDVRKTGISSKAMHGKGPIKCSPLSHMLLWGHLKHSFVPFKHSSIHIWSHPCFPLLSEMVFLTSDLQKSFFELIFFSLWLFFTFSGFLRPDIKMFVGTVMSVMGMIIFNDVFIQARIPA